MAKQRVRSITVALVGCMIIGLVAWQATRSQTDSVRILQAIRTGPTSIELGIDSCNNSAQVIDTSISEGKITVIVEHPKQDDAQDCINSISVEVPEDVTVVIDGSTFEEILIEPPVQNR